MSHSRKKARGFAAVARRFRRWRKRLYRRHPWVRRAVSLSAAGACLLAVLVLAVRLIIPGAPARDTQAAPEAEVAAPALGTLENRPEPAAIAPTAAPTALPAPTAAQATAGPEDSIYLQLAAPGAKYADPAANRLIKKTKVYEGKSGFFLTDGDIHMGSSDSYASLEGVTTFRGTNYRDGGGYGDIPENPTAIRVMWKKRIGRLDEWSGVGWTGQASVVRWPEERRQQMNIVRAKKGKSGLVEAIYATLDGHIYFLDLDDGQETRSAIDIGAPIKGSVAVDPRGLPLLYCGQGIYDVDGKRVDCGTRIFSLVDQQMLFFLDGKDSKALRAWRAFDCSPLVDAAADTMLTVGENGVLYKVKLNSVMLNGKISITPSVTRYVYDQRGDGKIGSENSLAVYNSYAYFATNSGVIQCVDLNTMQLVWSVNAKDDIDASLVVEPEADGTVALYAVNELDNRGKRGRCQMFKVNALTGQLIWKRDSDKLYQHNKNGGGGFATPAVGRQDLSGLVYFHICRTVDTKGMLYALDKQTGEVVWEKRMGSYGWSSPTCVYTASGKGYVLVGSSSGKLRLLDGLTGDTAAEIELKGNIEGSPAVFDDKIVIGTRDNLIYGLQIT